jgi:hypothetical protein
MGYDNFGEQEKSVSICHNYFFCCTSLNRYTPFDTVIPNRAPLPGSIVSPDGDIEDKND